jgi:lysophospholipid acyltransferase (LPLAT)-like uncharacterized protein
MSAEEGRPRRPRSNGLVARTWRKVRKPLSESRFVKNMLAAAIASALRFVRRTNRIAPGSATVDSFIDVNSNTIYVLWHGQHLLAPAFVPKGQKVPTMFSRSADAELNALAAERLGLELVRGSGGRDRARSVEKGGARALIALKKALDQGKSVCMIADIPHGTPREAGLGVITLSRISGRPIIGIALATSRRKVLEKSWDKTTINLPFGRYGIASTAPIQVPADASEAEAERYRKQLTDELNAATDRAYSLADGKS